MWGGNEYAKEKLSLGFWVTKIKTDTAGAPFPNSWCNQHQLPPPLTHSIKDQPRTNLDMKQSKITTRFDNASF